MTDPLRIQLVPTPSRVGLELEITPDLARRAGLPLALSFDGNGNPKWHWMRRHD